RRQAASRAIRAGGRLGDGARDQRLRPDDGPSAGIANSARDDRHQPRVAVGGPGSRGSRARRPAVEHGSPRGPRTSRDRARVDLNGIGDSDGADEQPLPNRSLYASQRTEQTLAILDQLAARGLPNRFVLGGLCSGAYWSVHAALADERVVGALMINLYAFFW